ncbi:virulence protein [Campylobacter sp. faydin G-140]|uniref:type IV secretion system protein n=1 Tax=Campylobacter anatolicus TaxID=2829105 RepID=UPI001B98B0C5|nr:VirB8/TrbF family protein [Campylobacter anatolicus]MBR8466530.1 virulence protein [Campylobacter anatolicus]
MAIANEKKIDPNFIFKTERNIKAYMLYTIIVLFLTIIGLVITLILLMPLKETKPYLLTFSNSDTNFVRISEGGIDIRKEEGLLKSILAGYVKNRETINRIDDIERYNIVRTQSKKSVWEGFQALVSQSGSIYTTNNLLRKIDIINIAVLSQNVATIDFQAETGTQSRNDLTYKKYRAAIEFDFNSPLNSQKEQLNNPTGFIVTKYAISEILEKDENKK